MAQSNTQADRPCLLAIVGECAPERGLAIVTELGAALRATFAFVRVLPPLPPVPEWKPLEASLQADYEVREKARFTDWINSTIGAEVGLEPKLLRAEGEFVETVERAIADWNASLIALIGVDEAQVAATTELAHASGRPVLIAAANGRASSTVLAATSLSDDELPVARYAVDLARCLSADVLVAHNDHSRQSGARLSESEVRAALATHPPSSHPVRVDFRVSHDASAEEAIVSLTQEQAPKLLVLGSYPRSWLTGWLVPSVSKAILSRVSCSVVVLPLSVESPT